MPKLVCPRCGRDAGWRSHPHLLEYEDGDLFCCRSCGANLTVERDYAVTLYPDPHVYDGRNWR